MDDTLQNLFFLGEKYMISRVFYLYILQVSPNVINCIYHLGFVC